MSRSDDNYGKAFQKYLKQVKKTSKSIADKEIKPKKVSGVRTKLVDCESEKKSIDKILTSIMYEQSPSTSYQNILQQVKKFSKEKKIKIINSFTNLRQNRRHRPSRAFESVYYTFDLLNN